MTGPVARAHSVGCTIWLTGLPGAGKSTIALALEKLIFESGRSVITLDGDVLRKGLNDGLGFDAAGRAEAVRRSGECALLLSQSGAVAIVSMVSPYRRDRDAVRARHALANAQFIEVFVDAPIAVVEARDPKGHYKKARAGTIASFTGVTDPYEAPLHPEVHVRTDTSDVHHCASAIFKALGP